MESVFINITFDEKQFTEIQQDAKTMKFNTIGEYCSVVIVEELLKKGFLKLNLAR